MNPIDKIKKGIINNDMEQIIQGFAVITGEEIRPAGRGAKEARTPDPKPEPATEETVQSSVQVRSKDLDFSTEPRESTSKYGRKESIEVGENQFIDDGTESKDITTPEVARTKRRPPVKVIKVKCHACGGEEEINAAYKTGTYHRCGKCVG